MHGITDLKSCIEFVKHIAICLTSKSLNGRLPKFDMKYEIPA